MGEVYRARDPRLQRDVALKFLPEGLAADSDRLARFTREAQTLASLNHPHIAQVHGLEESGPIRALVMEFVDGETLAARIARGALPIDEALPIARQIADALEAAHEKGIVHRDLKPANVMLTHDGQVKVLDFGLAKALDPSNAPDIANSPTLTFHATQAGIILGTAAYMSPEQARGRRVDKRSDVWSFGCVLYEMLAGRRAFDGEDATETIAAVVRAEPDWTALPPDVSEPVRLLLKRCLEKDPRARVADIAVARFLMTESFAPAAPADRARLRPIAAIVAAGLAGALIAGGAVWAGRTPAAMPRALPVRFAITPPASQPLSIFAFSRDIAISQDGSFLVYRSGLTQASEMTIRTLGSLEVRKLEGSVGRDPFVSPDSRWIGYFTSSELKKISITGGAPITVFNLGSNSRGGSWGADNRIVVAPVAQQEAGLLSVAASGGPLTVLTRHDASNPNDASHVDPFILPNGRAVLYTIMPLQTGQTQNAQIAVLDLRSGQSKTIVRGGTSPSYLETGHVLYATGRGLMAVPFDIDRLEVIGDAVPVLDQVMIGPTGVANYAVSRQGVLVYVPDAGGSAIPDRTLVWVTRQGKEESIGAPARAYAIPRISPDGTRLALDIRDARGNSEIWVWSLERRTLTPMSLDPGQDMNPLWTPDGRRIVWTSTRFGGNPNLVWQASDGTGPVERLTTGFSAQFPTSITADGSRVLLFHGNSTEPGAPTDVSTVQLTPAPVADRAPVQLLQSAATKSNGELSPDGRWLAYQSNESGQSQIYVRPYPNVDEGRTQISTTGGTRPVWNRNGRELFYLNQDDLLTAVAVQATPAGFRAGAPATILQTAYYAGASTRGYDLRAFDVSPDGQRFLMVKNITPAAGPGPSAPSIVVVLNWFDELKARLAAKTSAP